MSEYYVVPLTVTSDIHSFYLHLSRDTYIRHFSILSNCCCATDTGKYDKCHGSVDFFYTRACKYSVEIDRNRLSTRWLSGHIYMNIYERDKTLESTSRAENLAFPRENFVCREYFASFLSPILRLRCFRNERCMGSKNYLLRNFISSPMFANE